MADNVQKQDDTQYTKEFAARLMAVQAYYQTLQNKKPIKSVIPEYLERGAVHVDNEEDGDEGDDTLKPQGTLFKKILSDLDQRLAEVDEIVHANLNAKIQRPKKDEEGVFETFTKEPEPLLKAILFCAVCELLCNLDEDTPLIINDYLNVTHGYYERQQVSLVNGILDKVSGLLRG
ncbi:MAG: transcription antitermination factor NusB [Alphaproteobacteria bacterium]